MDEYKKFFEQRDRQRPRLEDVQVDMAVPVEERQKKRKGRRTSRRRRFLMFLLTLILLIAGSGGLFYAHTHDMLNIEEIQVSGNVHYETGQIVEMAGAVTGQRLLTEDTGAMEEALLRAPYIKAATVSKRLPHTLKITVIEREEAYAVSLAGSYVLIDQDAYTLRKANSSGDLIVIEDFFPEKGVRLGETYQAENQEFFNEVISLAESMQDYDLPIKRLGFSEGIISAYFYEGLVCKTTAEIFREHMADLKVFLEELREKDGVERGTIHIGETTLTYSPLVE